MRIGLFLFKQIPLSVCLAKRLIPLPFLFAVFYVRKKERRFAMAAPEVLLKKLNCLKILS